MKFQESEGTTVIVKKEIADESKLFYDTEATWAFITLTVHSDLQAVGFLARISQLLAEHGISLNVVSAYYHDHLFVPYEKAQETMNLLKSFSEA